MHDVIGGGRDLIPRQPDLRRQVPHRMKAAAKAPNLKWQLLMVGRQIACVIGSNHGDFRSETCRSRSDFTRIGADATHRWRKFARKEQNLQRRLNTTGSRGRSRVRSEFPDDSGTRARAVYSV